MIPIEDRLANHLTAVADYVNATSSDPGAATVIHRARRRQFRRRRLATGASALLLIGTAVTIYQVTSGRDPQRVIAGNGPADSSPAGDAEQAPSPELPRAPVPSLVADQNDNPAAAEPTPLATDLTWIHHDGARVMSGPSVRATDGTFYSIGTMPVTGDNPPVTMPTTGDGVVESVFKSADGIAWTPTPALNARMEDIYYGRWDAAVPRSLYSVGTEPARSPLPSTTPGGVLVARTSIGDTGNVLLTSPDLPALNAITKMEVIPGPTATGALGTLITATLRPTPFVDGKSPSADAINALGRFGHGDALLYFAADGQHFDEVHLAPVNGARWVHNAWATATGFSIVTTDSVDGDPATKTLTVHSSVDGRQWRTGPPTTITAPFVDVGVLTNGRMMFTGIGGSVTEVASTDGVAWTAGTRIVLPNATADGAPLQSAGGIFPQYVGADQAIFQSSQQTDAIAALGGVEFTQDGYIFRKTSDNGQITVFDATTGEDLGSLAGMAPGAVGAASVNADGHVVVPRQSGDVVLTVTSDDLFSHFQEALMLRSGRREACVCRVLQTSDAGMTWRVIDVEQVAGEPVAAVKSAGPTSRGISIAVTLVRGTPDGKPIFQVFEAAVPS